MAFLVEPGEVINDAAVAAARHAEQDEHGGEDERDIQLHPGSERALFKQTSM